MVHTLEKKQLIPIDLKTAWDFFSSPENLSKITPSELGLRITSEIPERMHEGLLIRYKVTPFPFFESEWITEITHIDEPSFFVDEQRAGPYSFWHHKHYFKEIDGGVEIKDVVDYALPFGPIGDIVNHIFVGRKLEFIFDYRYKEIEKIFGS